MEETMLRRVHFWWKKDREYPLKCGYKSLESGVENEIDMPYLAGEKNSMCPGDALSSGTAGYYLCALAKQAKALGIGLDSAKVRVNGGIALLKGRDCLVMNIQPEIEVKGDKAEAEELMNSVESTVNFANIYAVHPNIKQERMGGICARYTQRNEGELS
jgi:uncharacterized OsmC-like protein